MVGAPSVAYSVPGNSLAQPNQTIFPPDRIGKILYERLGEILHRGWDDLADRLAAERESWPLWLPVCLGAGIALYFDWPDEPPIWAGWGALLLSMVLAWGARRRPAALALTLGLALAALGFAAASTRTAWVAAPVLERISGSVPVTGTVAAVEPMPDDGWRITLDRVEAAVDGPAPTRIRLRFKPGLPPLAVGQRVKVRAVLIPPPQAVIPGGFDFARAFWFRGLGATGKALEAAESLEDRPPPDGTETARLELNRLRQGVGERIRAVLPGFEGGIATAIMTGETTGIPEDVLADFRNSGLAHILVIAGLHMGMVAGLVFFVVRGGLALIPAVALRWPIKKWAAAAALAITGAYMLLAGLPVPATRAFLMAAIVLVAVLLDRGALTLRLWAFAATLILLAEPEQLPGPSFQMSFAAVAALIATYRALGPRLALLRRRHRGRLAAIGHHLLRLAITSAAAGTATSVYGLYHFNRIALFQVVANLLAVPLTGAMVMPFALASLALMPLGLEKLALVPLGWGIDAIAAIAAMVSGWPHALLILPPLPEWGLVLFSLGGLWLCLWRGTWRLWGLVPMALGLASLALDHPPDLLVDGGGRAMAVRLADGSLLVSRGGRVLKDGWNRRAGPLAREWWPKHGHSGDGRLSCDEHRCLYRRSGHRIALVRDDDGIEESCSGPDLVISAVPIRDTCPGAATVIDRFDLWRRGTHAVWLKADGGVRIETVAGNQGDRPWSFHPHPRRPRHDDPADDDEPGDDDEN